MSVSPRARVTLLIGAVLALCGCAAPGEGTVVSEPIPLLVYPELTLDTGIPVLADVQYGEADGVPLLLDVCLPDDAATADRAAILAIHGGSWRRGDKSDPDQQAVCRWLAAAGYVTFSVNYRLAPAASFPEPLDDVRTALAWMREPAQLDRFQVDPGRIGVLGESAGANLGALLGLGGTGSWTEGTRVAAVAALSAPSDLRSAISTTAGYTGDFARAQLDYLGCSTFTDCATAAAASPITLVDSTDPPFFVAHAVDEFLPIAQSEALVAALREAGVPTTYVAVDGSRHALELLDSDLKSRIVAFFRDTLGPQGPVLAEPGE